MTESLGDPVGLCRRCAHHRPVGNRRGIRYYLCRRSVDDESFPRYPRLPVAECRGFEKGPEDPWLRYAEMSDNKEEE